MNGGDPGARDRSHYSYAHYANADVAAGFDALRFGGPIGRLLAETQERVIIDFLGTLDGLRVLDVGTGTGRAAIAIAARGARVTGVDASLEMLGVARSRASAAGVDVRFETADAHALPFADRSFDASVSVRVLMHTPGWQQALGELCRVTRTRVVFDYPSARSLAALQAGARRLRAATGLKTEAYRVFRPGRIRAALAARGFRIARVHRQFVLPIAIHKAIGSRGFTEASEGLLAAFGLNAAFGSPITIVAERCAS
jgi:2-polyprenyl-3-methyl-5-hydroxy-6-metoxy-1,4-benzoquinol methylase